MRQAIQDEGCIDSVVTLVAFTALFITTQVVLQCALEMLALIVKLPFPLVDSCNQAEGFLVSRGCKICDLLEYFEGAIESLIPGQVLVFVSTERKLLIYLQTQRFITRCVLMLAGAK